MYFSKLTLAVLLSTTLAGLATASTADEPTAARMLAYRDPQQNKGGKGGNANGRGGNNGGNNANTNKPNNKGKAANQTVTPATAAQPAAAAAGAAADAAGGAAKAGTATLNADALQTGSTLNGQEAGADPQQAPSATDPENFINFCSGQTLTNGLQIKTGSCNGIPMGKIPALANMISAVILFPQPGQDIPANKGFNISVQITHLRAGFFTNPQSTYYTAPQDLDENGDIIGHSHITVQDFGSSLTPTTPPDPTKFAFFKGVNDAGNGKGLLQAVVAGGLPPGNYRVCTMIAARNHQPVSMPVAQRGAQDDCTKFTVGKGGAAAAAAAGGAGADDGANAGAAAAAGADAGANAAGGAAAAGGKGGKGGKASAAPDAAAATPTAAAVAADANAGAGAGAAGGAKAGKGGKGGNSRKGTQKGTRGERFAERRFVS